MGPLVLLVAVSRSDPRSAKSTRRPVAASIFPVPVGLGAFVGGDFESRHSIAHRWSRRGRTSSFARSTLPVKFPHHQIPFKRSTMVFRCFFPCFTAHDQVYPGVKFFRPLVSAWLSHSDM